LVAHLGSTAQASSISSTARRHDVPQICTMSAPASSARFQQLLWMRGKSHVAHCACLSLAGAPLRRHTATKSPSDEPGIASKTPRQMFVSQ